MDFRCTNNPNAGIRRSQAWKSQQPCDHGCRCAGDAYGVLYALAGFSGGVTCYVKDGFLNYEFNLFEVQRTKVRSTAKLPTGKVKIEVESRLAGPIGGPMDITLRVNGEVVGQGKVPAAMSLHLENL